MSFRLIRPAARVRVRHLDPCALTLTEDAKSSRSDRKHAKVRTGQRACLYAVDGYPDPAAYQRAVRIVNDGSSRAGGDGNTERRVLVGRDRGLRRIPGDIDTRRHVVVPL